MNTQLVLLGKRINLARRAHRRWLVVLVYTGFAALVIAGFSQFGGSTLGLLILAALLLLLRIFGGRSYRGGLLPPFEGGDERELNRRYRAHYVAYVFLDLAFLPGAMAAMFESTPHNLAAYPALRGVLNQLPFELIIAAAVVYYTLPQAILLWTEPDMEEPQ